MRRLRDRGFVGRQQSQGVVARVDQRQRCAVLLRVLVVAVRLNDSQLDLENLARDVKTSDLAFSKSELIVTQLWKMEGYLNGLVKEYEEQRPLFPDTATTVPLEDHLRLADFLSSAKSSAFRPEVVDAFHKVQQAIREDLLRPRLPLGSSST